MRQSPLALTLALTTGAIAVAAVAQSSPNPAPKPAPAVAKAVADKGRSAENRARDQYRHPAETLAFFGVKPGQKLVEFSPGGGWYTEILARIPGTYTALVSSPRGAEAATKLLTDKALIGGVATMDVAAGTSTVAPASQDVVLTFRNVHNLVMNSNPAAPGNAFKIWFAMLKPGGTLGVVEHRLPETRDTADEKKSGYLKRSTVVALATAAGFKLVGESEVNANPKDTADYPDGVWTLPPTYRLKDVDRAKYTAIGESDRMTLRFVKPR